MAAVPYAYGPVPSRRLGRSLGINHIPAKTCSYACVYCQVGSTSRMQIERQAFFEPDDIFREVQAKVLHALDVSEKIDYLAFVPDGEPTLDEALGLTIDLLKPLGIPIGVITNSSLLWRDDVRRDLAKADWVSMKIDAVDDKIWRQVDRPYKALHLSDVLDGMQIFAADFAGKLVTETMLVRGVNDHDENLEGIAGFLNRLQPLIAYLGVPTRPPAVARVRGSDEETVHRAYRIFAENVKWVEYLIGYEGNAFASGGDVKKDLLSITAVHPMREDAVRCLLSRAQASWDIVDQMIAEGDLMETPYQGHRFYIRRFGRRTKTQG
ncbi:MAG: radical SAM protein [Candidatus Krumholzibacteria bacterium]|jgi:wyosine [tRNA(Phe)-imidazoG37] synthetase (radical SAM superfamily)|nr:radical SAM protein [Candidatus Krumholzibacteria bacterium]